MPNQQRLVALIIAALGYVVKFIAYSFLTPAVLMTFAALMFLYITLIGPEVPFLRYFAFMLPIDGRGNASLNEDDIMKVYGVLTMVLFGLSVIGGWMLRVLKRGAKRIFQSEMEAGVDEDHALASQNPLASAKRRLLIGSIVIAVIYMALFAVIPFARMAEGTSFLLMYPVFAIFGVVALISNAIHIGIDILSDMMLGWGWARVLNEPESI